MVSISPTHFDEQIATLVEMGYYFYSIDEFIEVVEKRAPLRKGVLVTFDDGFVDNWIWAYPILKKHGARATIFITPGRMLPRGVRDSSFAIAAHRSFARHPEVSEQFITHEEMALMSDSIDFQSHTMTHLRCDSSSEQSLAEIELSRTTIEAMTQKACHAFAWPYGAHNDDDRAALKRAGYKAVFTVETGVYTARSNPMAIKRIEMKDRGADFIKSRMRLYTTPLVGPLYAALKGILLIALLAIPQLGRADVITLKNGTTHFGIILEESATTTLLLSSSGEKRFTATEIARLSYDYEARFNALEERDLEGHRALATFCRQRKMVNEAIQQYTYLIAIKYAQPELHKSLGELYHQQKQYRNARRSYQNYWDLTSQSDPAIGALIKKLAKYELNTPAQPQTPIKPTIATPVESTPPAPEGLEESPLWEGIGWGNPATVANANERGNRLVNFSFKSGNKDKAVVALELNRDLSSATKLSFSLFNHTKQTLNMSIAFTSGAEATWFESREFRLAPERLLKKTVSLTAKTFKSEATKWNYTASITGKNSVKKLFFLVYNGRKKGMLTIDEVLFE